MFMVNDRQPFWLRRTTWGDTTAKVVAVGKFRGSPPHPGKREPISTFLDAGMTAMLGSVIEMGGWGDERGVVRGS